MKTKVIPTVFALSKKDFNSRFNRLIKVSNKIQIDFMDGRFVESKSILFSSIPDLKGYRGKFELHLMCYNPEKYLDEIDKKGFGKVAFHFEAFKKKEEIISFANKLGRLKKEVYLAVNPSTAVSEFYSLLRNFDGVLFLGVIPGKEGQKFIPSVLDKIKELRSMNRSIKIQVDGGVTPQIYGKLKRYVDYVNVGSYISNSEDPEETIREYY